MVKSDFRLPGPTPLPPAVLLAMARPMIPHRGATFAAFYGDLLQRVTRLHRTGGQALLWSASGSAGWEIALVNLCSPGAAVLSATCGDFGDRFRKVARALGYDVRELDTPWGQAVSPDALRGALAANPGVEAVLLTHNETSTGVTNDIRALAAACREAGALVIVDAVSSAAALPLEMDAWGIDVVLSGSQKAWMSPPGLAIVAFGPDAIARFDRSTFPRAFWDARTALAAAGKGMAPATPALSTLYAFEAAVAMIEQEGLEETWARHLRLGEQARRGIIGLGLRLFADPAVASDTVTAFLPPDGVPARALVDALERDHGVVVTGGQGHLADAMVRLGHMGWVDGDDIDSALEALAATLRTLAPAGRVTGA